MPSSSHPSRRIITLFLSSTGEMKEEPAVLRKVVDKLNLYRGEYQHFQLEIKTFRDSVASGVAEDVQSLINAELGNYDIYLGLMRHTLGSPTPRAKSGTAEELADALKAFEAGDVKRVMFYFRKPDVDTWMDSTQAIRYAEVARFRDELGKAGLLYKQYGELKEFEAQIEKDLLLVIGRIMGDVPAAAAAAATKKSAPTAAEILTFQPSDRALLFTVNHPIPAPKVGSNSESSDLEQIIEAPHHRYDGLHLKLGADPLDVETWEQLLKDCDVAIKQAKKGLIGRLHVYLAGPHPLALYLGHRLREEIQTGRFILYQFFSGQWRPMYASELQEEPKSPFFHSECKPVNKKGRGVALAISAGPSKVSDAQLAEFCKSHNIRSSIALTPAGKDGFIRTTAEGWGATEQIEAALRDAYGGLAKGEAIHIITTAGTSLVVALGLRLGKRVFQNIFAHQWLKEEQRYQQVLEVINGDVRPKGKNSELRIFPKGKVCLFEMDGRLLRCGLPILESTTALSSAQTPNSPSLRGKVKAFHNLIPPEVLEEIGAREALDISIEFTDSSGPSELPWELLFERMPRRQGGGGSMDIPGFASVREKWSVYRSLPERELDNGRSPKAASTRLKVLLVNALKPGDSARSTLDLAGWKVALEQAGAQVALLDAANSGGFDLSDVYAHLKGPNRPDVLHWVGHGQADEKDLWGPILEVGADDSTNLVDKTRLIAALGRDPVPLVVLSACSVGATGPGFGVPQTLLYGGVDAVVAFREPVSTKAITAFSKQLYASLLGGRRVTTALQDARRYMRLTLGNDTSFGAPVLWGAGQAFLGPRVDMVGHGSTPDLSGGSNEPLPLPDPKELDDVDVAGNSAGLAAWPSADGDGTLPIGDPKELDADPGVISPNPIPGLAQASERTGEEGARKSRDAKNQERDAKQGNPT